MENEQQKIQHEVKMVLFEIVKKLPYHSAISEQEFTTATIFPKAKNYVMVEDLVKAIQEL
jgi:hypothetical protein